MKPKDILQRNYVYLKDKLEVGRCLDYLFQEGVLTTEEFDTCVSHQNRSDKCGCLLDLLMRKEEEGYRTFCAVLEKIGQTFLKEKLDETSAINGALSLLYVNKEESERKHKITVNGLENHIDSLTRELEQKNKDITDVVSENEKNLNELKAEHHTQRKTDRDELQSKILKLEEDLREEKRTKIQAERNLSETRVQNRRLEDGMLVLQKEFKEIEEKYAAIAKFGQTRVPRIRKTETETTEEKDELCVVCHKTVDADENVFLLGCLHTICQNCWDTTAQHSTEVDCSTCQTRSSKEQIRADTARRNKMSLESVKTNMKCKYNISHIHEAAVTYCQDCGLALCLDCQNLHKDMQLCIGHETHKIEELGDIPYQKLVQKRPCPRHDTNVVKLYDTDCEMSICLVCSQESHKGHNMTSIDSAYELARSSLEDDLRDLQGKSSEIERRINEVRDHEKILDDTEDTLVRNVAKIREEIALLLLHREKDVCEELEESFKELRMALSEKLNRLQDIIGSLNTTTGFIKKIMDFCGKSEFIELKSLVEAKAKLDMAVEIPEDDRRDTKIQLSVQGLRALENQISSFLCLYSLPQESDYDALPDDIPTTQEFQRRIIQAENELASLTDKLAQCEKDLDEVVKAKNCETNRRIMMEEENKMLSSGLEEGKSKALDDKKELLSKVQRREENIQQERENNTHLSIRCGDLEEKLHQAGEKIKTLEADSQRTLQSTSAESERIKKRCNQLEQTLDQTYVCVGRHRPELERCLIVCPKLSFNPDLLSNVGIITEGQVFTNIQSERPAQQPGANIRPFMKYCGTVSSESIFPAPYQLHDNPIFWEIGTDIDFNSELPFSQHVFEIGVIDKSALDRNPLAYLDPFSWCVVLKFCMKHKSICTQVWQKGKYTTCFNETLPNRSGASATLQYGGILDIQKGKLAFLDITREITLGSFDIGDNAPLLLTFGIPPRTDNINIKMKLTSPRELLMTTEKKNLISKALQQM